MCARSSTTWRRFVRCAAWVTILRVDENEVIDAPDRRLPDLDAVFAAGIVVLTVLLAVLLAPAQPDTAYVSYRYARHVADGTGFVYNPGNGQHVAVAPLYVLALAGLSSLVADLPALGVALNALFVGAGGLLMLLGGRDERDRVERGFAALVYVAFPLWWLEAGGETALIGLLALGAVLAQSRGKSLAAALLAGLALLVRPVAVLIGLALVVDVALDQRRVPWQEGLTLVACGWLSGILTLWSFGWPWPAHVLLGGAPGGSPLVAHALTSRSLAGLGRLGGALLAQSWGWGGLFLLAGVGLAWFLDRWWPLLLLVWAFLHGVALDILRVPPTRGDYAPLVPVLAALVGMGAAFAWERLAERAALLWGLGLLVAGAVLPSLWAIRQAPTGDDAFYQAHGPAMLPDTPRDSYREAGEWLAEHAPGEATIAASHIGQLGYYAERNMLDANGFLVAGGREALLHADAFWYLPDVAPDYVVVSRTGPGDDGGYRPLDDAWFAETYAEVQRFGDAGTLGGPLVIYQRRDEASTREELDVTQAVEVRYANGLRLEGYETNLELDPLPPGELMLLRLAWLPTRALPEEQLVVVRLESREGVSAGQVSQTAPTGQWTPGAHLTTYHSFETADALVPGLYELKVGVGQSADRLEWQVIARAKVPLGEAPFGGGLSGGGGSWPGLAALRGYRLNRTEDGLGVALLWEALAAPDEDYTVRLALIDQGGDVVTSVEAPPRGDTYPTSIWAEGEQIPDEQVIPLDGVPPGAYSLVVSWLGPDGEPVPTGDGQDALEMAPFRVE